MIDRVTFKAWAINTCSTEGHGFIGKYWWFDGCPPIIPYHLDGCLVALFKTRSIARRELKKMRNQKYQAFSKAKVIRVEICIKQI